MLGQEEERALDVPLLSREVWRQDIGAVVQTLRVLERKTGIHLLGTNSLQQQYSEDFGVACCGSRQEQVEPVRSIGVWIAAVSQPVAHDFVVALSSGLQRTIDVQRVDARAQIEQYERPLIHELRLAVSVRAKRPNALHGE